MTTIDYVVRSDAGISRSGIIGAQQSVAAIDVARGQEISLNLRQTEIAGYQRDGSDLMMTLADGRVIVLENYYGEDGAAQARLFISADGYLNEVTLIDGVDGAVYAQYGPTAQWGKWSPDDDLIFLGGSEVAAAPAEQDVSMLGAALLGGGGLFGAAGAGAAAVGAATLIGGGDGGGGGIPPSINEAGPIVIGGDGVVDPGVSISGRAEPGSNVVVSIGGTQITVVADAAGDWVANFQGGTFPADGQYVVGAVVTDPGGTVTTLGGPDVVIDLTPPNLTVESGTEASGHIVNLVDHGDGVTLGGSGEPGATISVLIEGVTQETVVTGAGTWEVTFAAGTIPGGERRAVVEVTSRDSFGNSTVITDAVALDTVPHPVSITGVGGDGVVNAAEAAGGVVLSGGSAPGAVVTVTMGGVVREVVTGADGVWRAVYEAGTVPGGEYDAAVSARTVDGAGNASSTTATVRVDTAVNAFTLQGNPGGADGVINAAEQGGGFTLTGQVEPGSAVVVSFAGSQVSAVVAADGSWTATFTGAQIPGGTYGADAVALATDAAGNTRELRTPILVDTEAGRLVLNEGTIGGDGIINAAEADAGVRVTGEADPGAVVIVSLDGVEHSVVANGAGQWQTVYATGEITRGVRDPVVSARTVDAAGNVAQVSGAVHVDTQVDNLSLQNMNVAIGVDGRDVINDAVNTGGFSVTGTIEPGSRVFVSIDGVRHEAVVTGGNWVVDFGPNELADGERVADMLVEVIDPAGNPATLNDTVRIDTLVNTLDHAGGVGGDGVVNIAEAAAGITLSGRVEPGSTAQVEVFGQVYDAVVDGAGNWSLAVPGADVPAIDGPVNMVVTATDGAGNTAVINDGFTLDLVAPGTPDVTGNFRGTQGFEAVRVVDGDGTISINQIEPNGAVNAVDLDPFSNPRTGETEYSFLDSLGQTLSIPDGSQLVVSSTDAGGNVSSTQVVLDVTQTTVVDVTNPNLAGFNIETIDLRYGDNAQLSLTEAQVRALSENSDTVMVQGGVDDQVTITGAVAGGSTPIGGQAFDIYTLGVDATVVVDSDIQVVT